MIARSVVVGVDDSTEARDAAVLGRRLAAAARGSLHLVTAAYNPLADTVLTRLRLDTDALHEALVAAARKTVEDRLCDVFEPDEMAGLIAVRVGRPEYVLAEYGREVGADLFVLGGRRHATPASWIRRGTAHHLLRVGECPVLITGPGGPEVERVLAAVDLSSAAGPTIDVAARIAQLLGTGMEALHVVGHPAFPTAWELALDVDRLLEEQEEQARRELWPLLPEGASGRTVLGETVPAIREAAEAGPPTLLVVGAQGRGRIHRLLLGSTTEALLAALPSSLAIVPATHRETP